MSGEWSDGLVFALAAATLRLATPLVFAALGGLFSERAGVINIALEGFMLVGAFAAAVVTLETASPWWGVAAAMAAGGAFAAVYALFVIRLRTDQIVAGTAMNFLAMGIPPLIAKVLYDVTGSTPPIPVEHRFTVEPTLMAAALVVGVWGWMRYSVSGLWVQFAGEHPEALAAAGVRVVLTRWFAVILSGAIAGIGGAALSIALSSSYSRNMTAGRGFMALAALILGKWRPVPAAVACLLLAFTDAVQMRLQGAELGGWAVPVQFIQILPYVATVLVLAGFVGSSRAPSALGKTLK